MNIKNLFKYKPQTEYDFSIQQSENAAIQQLNNEKIEEKVYNSIQENLEFMKSKYNSLINSDIIIRDFFLICKNKKYKAFLMYVDEMTDSMNINHFVLKPLMLRNQNNTYTETDSPKNPKIIRKIKKSDLSNYIYNNLIPNNNLSFETEFSKIISDINAGNCVLFVDSLNVAFDIDGKGFKQRSVDRPQIENVIKGPQEAFVENIRTNTALLRRIVNNQNLIIENLEIGELSQTKCALCYMQNIANGDLIAEAKYRLNNLSIDALISSGEVV